GRTDIPGADEGKLITNIRKHLLVLPDDTRVLPGHGPPTTIGAERATNPYVGS
ncbi:MAG: MBL fold metallo-hydrolase, partial [Phycisphaerae bacterium]|nr:MBL fold metallo-hydrolase [Phycisphaerae bacterium]